MNNEDLLRYVRAHNYPGDPVVEQLHNALEGVLDELDEALEEIKVLKAHFTTIAEEVEVTGTITFKLEESVAEAGLSLDRLETQLTNR